jgi:iron complex outermembrane receptor protein
LRANILVSDDWKAMLEAGRSWSERDRIQCRIVNYNILSGAGTENIVNIHNQRYLNTFLRAESKGHFETGPFKHGMTLGVSSSERYYNGPGTFTDTSVHQNIYQPATLPAPAPLTPAQLAAQTFAPQDPQDVGVYAYDTVQIGSRWKILAGVRETDDMADDANTAGVHVKSSRMVCTPAAGLLYDVAPRTTVYASYMDGLVEGSQAPQQAVNSFQILAPTLATQKEIGVRSSFFHGLTASAAYFNINLANSNLDAITNVFQNDGITDYEGVEETLKAEINRWWSVDAAGQQLRAIENPVIDLALKGLMPENTAKVSGNMLVTHRSPWIRGLTVTAGASYLGRRFVNSNDQGAVPGFVLYNVGAGYSTRILGRKVAFQVNVDNLFNKAYWNSATSTAYGPGMVRSLKGNTRIEF